jgi:DnaJ family protein C protein 3
MENETKIGPNWSESVCWLVKAWTTNRTGPVQRATLRNHPKWRGRGTPRHAAPRHAAPVSLLLFLHLLLLTAAAATAAAAAWLPKMNRRGGTRQTASASPHRLRGRLWGLRALQLGLALACVNFGSVGQAKAVEVEVDVGANAGMAADSRDGMSASDLRSSADMAMSKGDHDTALDLFSAVIEMEPTNERNYYKRFRVHLKKGNYPAAIGDLSTALGIKPKYKQALASRAHVHRLSGDCKSSVVDYTSLQALDPKHKDLEEGLRIAQKCSHAMDRVHASMKSRQYSAARDLFDDILMATEVNHAAILMDRARCSKHLKDELEVVGDLGRVIKMEPDNIEALEMRGWSYYWLGDIDMASNHFKEVLKFDPEHKNCKEGYKKTRGLSKKIKQGEELYQSRRISEAIEKWEEAARSEPNHVAFSQPLWQKVSEAHHATGRWAEAIAAAQESLRLADTKEVQLIVGDAYMRMEKFEEAVQAFNKALQHEQNSNHIRQKLNQAQVALKQSKQKNYYKILGIRRDADTKAIKKAYRELALKWHPDKWQTEEEKEAAEEQFQQVAEANEVLSDPELRQKYDRGEDVFPNQGNDGAGHYGRRGGFNPFGGGNVRFHFG